MPLELFARSLFGDKYFGSVNWTEWTIWKRFFLRSVCVLEASLLPSIGSVDEKHREDLARSIGRMKEDVKNADSKDRMNTVLIIGLLKLVFLLSGRLPYYARGSRRNLNTFRTLSYCQTDEQLSWLLQAHIQKNAEALGFVDSFEADLAHFTWAKANKRKHSDRAGYVQWVRETYPEVLLQFR